MACKLLCRTIYRAKKQDMKWYTGMNKRCNTCEAYIVWGGVFCPCCGKRVRNKPYNSKWKKAEVARY